MLKPTEIENKSMSILKLYESMEDDLLNNIAKRLELDDTINADTIGEWQVKKLMQMGSLKKENIKVLAKRSKKTQTEIKSIMKSLGYGTIRSDEEIYQKAYKAGKLLNTPIAIGMSPTLNKIIEAAVDNATSYLNLINTTALESAKEGYLNIINQVYLETSLGITDYNSAVKKAVKKLADKGITGATYMMDDGRIIKNNIDVAIRRNILTSSSQTAGKMQMARAKEWESNLVEVTSHGGARPDHAKWQGAVYSIDGSTKEYPNLYSVTDYGSKTGLKGINCRHDFYPFFEGISEQTYKPYDLEENEKIYKESQQQRKIEREIRAAKRERDMFTELGDTKSIEKAKDKLKAKQAKMRAFTEETGRTRRSAREAVQFNTVPNDGNKIKPIEPKPIKAEPKKPKPIKKVAVEQKGKFKEAKNIKEAEAYAKQDLGIKNVNYKGVDITTANEWNKGLKDNFDRMPELKNKMNFVGECGERNKAIESKVFDNFVEQYKKANPYKSEETIKSLVQIKVDTFMGNMEVSKNAFAQSWSPKADYLQEFQGVTVNANWGKNSNKFVKTLTKNVKSQFHPIGGDTIRSVLDHEIGHQIDDLLGISKLNNIKSLFNSRTKSELTREISRYAVDNKNPNKYGEFIAEGWSEYLNNPNPRAMAKEIGQTIEREYKKQFK